MSTDDTTPTPDAPVLPAGPPWTLDVLADLHADRYPAEIAAQLRPLVAADPWATSVLGALDTTVDQLSLLPAPRMPERFALRLDAALAAEQRAVAAATGAAGPAIGSAAATADRVVPHPRQGLDQSVSASPRREQQGAGAALPPRRPSAPPPWQAAPPAATGPVPAGRTAPPGPSAGSPPPASGPAPTQPPATGGTGFPGAASTLPTGQYAGPVASLDAARAKRRRWIGGLAAAAAIIGIGTASVAALNHSGDTPGVAAAPSSAPAPVGAPAPGNGNTNALQLDPGRIGEALQQIEGRQPVGSLQNAATYARCLAANAIDPSAVEGVVAATFQGKPAAAIAVVVDAGHSRVVVVGPGCGINGAADQLAAQTVTR